MKGVEKWERCQELKTDTHGGPNETPQQRGRRRDKQLTGARGHRGGSRSPTAEGAGPRVVQPLDE